MPSPVCDRFYRCQPNTRDCGRGILVAAATDAGRGRSSPTVSDTIDPGAEREMPITIGAKQESDFSDPIGMLGDCHRRIERFLSVLLKLASEREGAALNQQEQDALSASLRYFRDAA